MQNEQLTSNLTTEPMVRKVEQSGQYKHIFTFKNQMVRVIRDLRVAQVFTTFRMSIIISTYL